MCAGRADDATVLGDVAHVVSGDLRRTVRDRASGSPRLAYGRNALGRLLQERKSLRCAWSLRKPSAGDCDWRWEKQGSRNTRVLYGAMGHLDRLMAAHHLEPVIEHVHQHLVEVASICRRVLAELLDVVAKTDADLRRSSTARFLKPCSTALLTWGVVRALRLRNRDEGGQVVWLGV